MFIIKKNDIKAFPFEEASVLAEGDLETWAVDHNLSNFNLWMMPQLEAYFGSLKVNKNEAGLYDPKLLWLNNFKDNAWAIGVWRVCTKLKRSSLVKSQVHPHFSRYSALVPLILSGLKVNRGINYSEWSRDGLQHFFPADLWEAASCSSLESYSGCSDLGSGRLLEIRNQGITTKSGSKMGEMKKPTSAWCLTGVKNTEIGELPRLAQTMLTQIWVAHPTIRNSCMILDPSNWDAMPTPLVGGDVVQKETTTKTSIMSDLPNW